MQLSHRFYATSALILGIACAAAAPWAQSQSKPHLTLQDIVSPDGIGPAALSPDGKTFALTREGQIVLLPVNGTWPTTLTITTGGKAGLAWPPDGKRLAYVSQGSIWVVSIAGGAPRRLTNAPAGEGDPRQAADRDPQWSPKGRWILFQSGRRGRNSLLVVSSDGDSTNFLTEAQEQAGEGKWSPSGDAIVYVARSKEHFSGQIKLIHIDANAGQRIGESVLLYTSPVDRGGGWSIRGAEWSPDGREVVTVLQNSGGNHLYLLSIKGGEPKQI